MACGDLACYIARCMIRHVVWDWNGTLLDDVEHALIALNKLLAARDMPLLDHAGYRERFGFPVRDFYVGLGFDFAREDFAALSETFIAHYRAAAENHVSIHAEVLPVMHALRTLGVGQSVLSAMEINLLGQMLRDHGLSDLLSHVRGLSNQQASSKVTLGIELQRTLALPADEVLFVGDTLHDHETAQAMGAHCLLFARGHQTHERLRASGAEVIDSLHAVEAFVRARLLR